MTREYYRSLPSPVATFPVYLSYPKVMHLEICVAVPPSAAKSLGTKSVNTTNAWLQDKLHKILKLASTKSMCKRAPACEGKHTSHTCHLVDACPERGSTNLWPCLWLQLPLTSSLCPSLQSLPSASGFSHGSFWVLLHSDRLSEKYNVHINFMLKINKSRLHCRAATHCLLVLTIAIQF